MFKTSKSPWDLPNTNPHSLGRHTGFPSLDSIYSTCVIPALSHLYKSTLGSRYTAVYHSLCTTYSKGPPHICKWSSAKCPSSFFLRKYPIKWAQLSPLLSRLPSMPPGKVDQYSSALQGKIVSCIITELSLCNFVFAIRFYYDLAQGRNGFSFIFISSSTPEKQVGSTMFMG